MRPLLAIGLTLLCSGAAFAQTSSVPPEDFNNSRRLSGDAINVCFDRTSLGRPFDEAGHCTAAYGPDPVRDPHVGPP